MAIEAWFVDENGEDQRQPHHRDPPEYMSPEQLVEIGVLHWRLNSKNYENDDDLKKIRDTRGYNYMVFDYLEETAVCNQIREIIVDFSENYKKFNLAKAEILNIINVIPSSLVEIFPIIEEYESRFGENAETMEELVESINNTLPAPPMPIQPDVQVGEEEETPPNVITVEATK